MSVQNSFRTTGVRLRQLRLDRGWTLKDVEELTAGKITASALGSYERMERSISLPKLRQLAQLYEAPLAFLLEAEEARAATPQWQERRLPLRIRVPRLKRVSEFVPVRDFIDEIKSERSDFGAQTITIRGGDVRTLALLMKTTPADLLALLEREGIVDAVLAEVTGPAKTRGPVAA